MQFYYLALMLVPWIAFWVVYLGVVIPVRRLYSMLFVDRPKLTYLQEVDKVTRPMREFLDVTVWILVPVASVGMVGLLNWLAAKIPTLDQSVILYQTLLWLFLMIPFAVLSPRNRRKSVLYGFGFYGWLVFLGFLASTGSKPRHLEPMTIGYSLVGFVGAYAVAYQLDKIAYQKSLLRPRTWDEPEPTFDSPLNDLRKSLSRKSG